MRLLDFSKDQATSTSTLDFKFYNSSKMVLPFARLVALACLVTASPHRLNRRQDAESSVSGGGQPSSAVASPDAASASISSVGASNAVASPEASSSSTADGGAVSSTPPSAVASSTVPTASGESAISNGTAPVSPAPTASASSNDTNAGNGAAAGPTDVYTTTVVLNQDPFPFNVTVTQTITPLIPAQATGVGNAGGFGGVQTVQGPNKVGGVEGTFSQIISASQSEDGSIVTQTFIPQPPIPSKTASADDSLFTPTGYDGATTPQRREFTFDIEYTAGSPDGFHRRISTVNGLFPGPLIEANKGDTLVIHVNNKLDDGRSQSIHWHGMRQLGTPHMDGVPGITQCPIPAGGSFTYEFSLDSEMGTYWWHSHSGNTQADGLSGGLIVHSPDEPYQKGRDYDEERVVYLQDWMRDQSDDILAGITSNLTYRGLPVVGAPDASLVNGVGQSICEDADPSVQCDQTTPRTMTVPIGKTRFRVINMGSHAMYRISVDRHDLKVIEIDDTPIEPVSTHEIPMHPGQRYSFILETNVGSPGDKFFLRSRFATGCMARSDRSQEQKMIIQYAGDGGQEATDEPWGDLAGRAARCVDFEHPGINPVGIPPVPQDSFAIDVFNTKAGRILNHRGESITGFTVNDTSFVNFVNKPALRDVIQALEFNRSAIPAMEFSGNPNGSVDILINSLDPDRLSHPFHLHSRPFYIIGRGSGSTTPDSLNGMNINLENPLRRDVITLAGQEWALLRVPADTPGVWPFHCHIGWHLAVGKLGVVVMQPELLRQTVQLPDAWNGLCAGTDPGLIDAGRRRRALPA